LIGEIRVRLKRLTESIPPAPPGVNLEGESLVLAIAQKAEDDPLQRELQRALKPGLREIARSLRDPDPRIRLATVEFLEAQGDDAAEAVTTLRESLEYCDRFV